MLSQKLQNYACEKFRQALPSFGNCAPQIEENLATLTGDELTLMQLTYGTLPTSDVCTVPFAVLQSYARHALLLRAESPYSKDLPEDMFLHFVFYPRVNSENLVDCRPFFYRQVAGSLEGLSETEAALTVNRWCAAQMRYQTTNDRTESPLAAYYSGLGRCGEESTFAVSVFRSVGIPARQVYVPWWSHCDDNHAWVEVYADGKWNFLGACESEPVLNKGWFIDASSRALLECYRTCLDFVDEGMKNEQLVERRGVSYFYNQTKRYAYTTPLTLMVTDEEGRPAENAQVRLEVMNMATYSRAAQNVTDENGILTVNMGRGSVHVDVLRGSEHGMADLVLGEEPQTVHVTLRAHQPLQGTVETDFIAPLTSALNKITVSAELLAESAQINARCEEARLNRINSYFKPEYTECGPEMAEILRLAAGNADEIYQFYIEKPETERPLAVELLKAMASKDYRDTSCAVLDAHFYGGLRAKRSEEHFVSEVMNPRIRYEMIEDWRSVLENWLTPEQQAAFVADPAALAAYIGKNYPDGAGRYYPILSMVPSATLAAGHTDEKGRRLLFVAAMRTLGVPARINPADDTAEYWRDGTYHCVNNTKGEQAVCLLHLTPQEGKRFVYASNYSLAKWGKDGFVKLDYSDFSGEKLSDPFTLRLPIGEYRLTTIDRLPNGNQLCRLTYFTLEAGEEKTLPLLLREAAPEEMLANSALDAFALRDAEGKSVPCEDLLAHKQLLIYLGVGAEPTEHILNELIAAAPEIQRAMGTGLGLGLVVRGAEDLENRTLKATLEALPETRVWYDDFGGTATMLARKMFLEPGVWPLLVLADEARRGYYGSCGYQVGVVEFALKLAECIQ